MTTHVAGTLPLGVKISLALRAWFWFVAVHLLLRTRPLPQVVERVRAGAPSERTLRVRPARLGAIIGRVLRLRRKQARCLVGSLVLYRLLSEQGTRAELVIGLPVEAKDHRAHAWVEVDGLDVGPPPGHHGHLAIARYG